MDGLLQLHEKLPSFYSLLQNFLKQNVKDLKKIFSNNKVKHIKNLHKDSLLKN